MPADRTFVGFGFGAIQAGLFLYEAFRSGRFGRLVVAEVLPEMVAAVRQSAGLYRVNIAHPDGVTTETIGPIEIADPNSSGDRPMLVQAVAEASEISTALPSVDCYAASGPGSVHQVLAAGLSRKAADGGPRAIVYAAENDNRAAERLELAVFGAIPKDAREPVRRKVQILNTVIGKMSGTVSDPVELRERGLVPITPAMQRAFLVECFNRIIVSKVSFEDPPFTRGFTVFEEKPDLLPFEEAKLYGHNATHALAAYIGAFRGVARIARLAECPGVPEFLEAAFVKESGQMLILRHPGVDVLFTQEGYQSYAADLLARMFNPQLGDTVDRVGRDPARKLGWSDRLVGTIRIGLRQQVPVRRYAMGAAAALATFRPCAGGAGAGVADVLDPLWSKSSPDPWERETVLAAIDQGRQDLWRWREQGYPHLEGFVSLAIDQSRSQRVDNASQPI